jgi:hypothetical protein
VKTFLRASFFISLVFCMAGQASATSIGESESNDSFATAQNINSFFSLDAVANIFNSTTVPHVSISGTNGATSDVDYYQFTVATGGSTGFFDIDGGETQGVFVDTTLSLFDSTFGLLAFSDDSAGDPGSVGGFGLDSFIGVYTFANPGTYYVAVSNFANLPLSFGTHVGDLTRPDGAYGGDLRAGDSGPTAVLTFDGGYPSGDYTLHVSLSSPGSAVPEPSTVVLMGLGLVGLGVAGRRKLVS